MAAAADADADIDVGEFVEADGKEGFVNLWGRGSVLGRGIGCVSEGG